MWIACRQVGLVASETGEEANSFCETRLQVLALPTRVANFSSVLIYIDRYVDSAHPVLARRLLAFLVNDCIANIRGAPEESHQLVLIKAANRFPTLTACAF